MELLVKLRSNIHFHVWEYQDMMKLFVYLTSVAGVPLNVEMSFLTGNEVIWILRKQ